MFPVDSALDCLIYVFAYERSTESRSTCGATGGRCGGCCCSGDKINREHSYHVLTIEDPIEFLHPHKNCVVNQRELHSDTPSFALALRAALRQAPKVILVGEMRDKETIEIAIEAAETGHRVLSTLHTIDASKTVERIVGAFPMAERTHSAQPAGQEFSLHHFAEAGSAEGQDGAVAVIEILKATLRSREYVEKGESEGKTLLDAMRVGEQEGMQTFDGDIERLIRAGVIDMETGLAYATNPGNLQLDLSDLRLEAEAGADRLLENSVP